MDIRILDGDDPRTVDLLLPGFRRTAEVDLPEDPPVSAALLARLLQTRRNADRLVIAAFEGAEPVGYTKLGLDRTSAVDTAHGSLWVFPPYRRRGFGRGLVAAAWDELRPLGRTTLLLDAPHSVAADGFAAALAGHPVATNLRNRLGLRGRGAGGPVAATGGRPAPELGGARLVCWTERCPDSLVEGYARTWSTVGARLNGQSDSSGLTVAGVRQAEREAVRAAHRQYAVAAVDPDSGEVRGFSTLFVRDSPMADSGQTAVLPEYRRRGLATALKTYVIDWAVTENPHLALLQAWNGAGDGPVLALNRKLGFVADQRWTSYRFIEPAGFQVPSSG